MARQKGTGWKIAAAVLCLIAGAGGVLAFEIGWLGASAITVNPPDTAVLSLPYSQCHVAILNSEYSSRFFQSAKSYDAHVEYWQSLLQGLQMPSEVIGDARLEAGLQGFQVLVIPSAICLSKNEKASLRAFAASGGGIICTWATGARDESGKWQGMDFLQDITGADKFDFTQRTPPWYVSFVSRRPTTLGGPGGFRIQVDSPDRLEAKSFGVDAYWSDPRLFPVDPNNPIDFQGALIHNNIGRGRLVWLGFQENTAVAGGHNKEILDQVLINSLLWVGGLPLFAIDRWPSAYSAAAIFACDVEDNADNAAYAATTLRRAGEKGTFFAVSSLIKGNPDLARQLVNAGELASHGDTRERFASAGAGAEALRLEKSKWGLWRAAGISTDGFHPPADAFEAATLRALGATGFKYLLTSLDGGAQIDSVLPQIQTVSQSLGWFHRRAPIVVLIRTTEDDFHYSPLGIVGLDPSWITQRALADFEIIHSLGGLYIFNYHSQGFSSPEFVGGLDTLIDQFHRNATWIATAGEVADWREMRSHLALAVSTSANGATRLSVPYDGRRPLDDVTLSVYAPAGFSHARIVAVGATQATAEVAPESIDGRLTVRLGRLVPKTTSQYELTWTN